MDWLKNLLSRFKGDEDEVVIVKTPGKVLKAVKTYEKAAANEKLIPFFTDFLSSGYRFLFFDPEETTCYYYFLKDNDCRDTGTISNQEWEALSAMLKEISYKIIPVNEKEFLCIPNFSLTNLGERASVVLIDPDTEPEILKELKRKAIQTVNRLRPATSLTHNNINNIIDIVERRKDYLNGSLHDYFLQDNLIGRDEAARLREKDDYKALLRKPLARKQVVSNVAKWLGVDYFDVEIDNYDKYSASTLPEDKAVKYGALLIDNREDGASVAFTDPFNSQALSEIETALGKKVKVYMACEEDIRYEHEKVYRKY